MPSTTLQRAIWDGHPVQLGNAFELRRRRGTRELHAICRLESHLLGWQLFLEVEGLLSRIAPKSGPKIVSSATRAACVAAVSLLPGKLRTLPFAFSTGMTSPESETANASAIHVSPLRVTLIRRESDQTSLQTSTLVHGVSLLAFRSRERNSRQRAPSSGTASGAIDDVADHGQAPHFESGGECRKKGWS